MILTAAAHGRSSSAPQGIRRGSADDYDHLERCSRANAGGAYRQKYSSSCSSVARDPHAHQLATHHQKASRSFDIAELPAVVPIEHRPPGGRGPQPTSFTAAAKSARGIQHSRSKSDPDDLIVVEKATPTNGHTHRSARGSLSPAPLNPYVNTDGDHVPSSPSHSRYALPIPLVSPISNSTFQRLTGPGRKRGVADHTPHQRYHPSSSDDSHSRGGGGAEPEEQTTPKNTSKVT